MGIPGFAEAFSGQLPSYANSSPVASTSSTVFTGVSADSALGSEVVDLSDA
jgi:hypothetical protein